MPAYTRGVKPIMRVRKVLLVLAFAFSSLASAPVAQAETCQEAITLWSGTPWERSFPRVCGEEARLALWNTQLGPYLDANSAAVAAWSAQQAAEQAAQQAAAQAAEAARQAEEQAARDAAAAAADAANCADAATVYPGTQWARTFPAVCTAAAIQARSEEIRIYSENVSSLQASQSPNEQPNPANFDCNLTLWQNTAFCINQTNTPPPAAGTPPASLDCGLPQNVALPICTNNQPLTNPDATINCANPTNAITTTCMDLFQNSSAGGLDCSRSELRNMPACLTGTAIGGPNAPTAPTNNPSQGAINTVTSSSAAAQPVAPINSVNSAAQNNSQSSAMKASEKVSTNKEELFAEEDGEEEPPAGELSVTFNSELARYVVKIECNLAGERLTVRGVKKGAKGVRYTISIDEDGIGGVRTKTKLSGYTLTLYYGSTKLDQVRVK